MTKFPCFLGPPSYDPTSSLHRVRLNKRTFKMPNPSEVNTETGGEFQKKMAARKKEFR